ncbi:hypothetical protein GVN20_20740 [Runella sp. CRIBMP]|uniref:hypothetical protein n=1 Tax=Runella sp. CRIBMP TaxID=2683261 RepID=UPI0014137818|nr:hypothetical protein [Runella sp. CRIBMP]NBB21803.1 hypothetical protein [Runella sp. CRIBMP]
MERSSWGKKQMYIGKTAGSLVIGITARAATSRDASGCGDIWALTVLQTLCLFFVRSIPSEDTAQRGTNGGTAVSLVIAVPPGTRATAGTQFSLFK